MSYNIQVLFGGALGIKPYHFTPASYDDTIDDLKSEIHDEMKISWDDHYLLYKNNVLCDDDKTLFDYGLHGQDVISLRQGRASEHVTEEKRQHKIDDKLVHILQYHKLYEDLYAKLNDNEYDLDLLIDTEEGDIDEFSKAYGLTELQKIKFRKLLKIVHNYDDNQYQSELIQQKTEYATMNVLIIGKEKVGKTSMIRRYIHNCFDEAQKILQFDKKEELSDGKIMKLYIETLATNQDNDKNIFMNNRRKDCIIICYCMKDITSTPNIKTCDKIIDKYGTDDVVVMLVGCQSDRSDENRFQFEAKARDLISQEKWKKYGTIYCECSALIGDNVNNIFNVAAELVYQIKNGHLE